MPSACLCLLVLFAWSFTSNDKLVDAKHAQCVLEERCTGVPTPPAPPNVTEPACNCPPLPFMDEAAGDPTMVSTYEPALTGAQPCGTTVNIVCTWTTCTYPAFVCSLLTGLTLNNLPNPVHVYQAPNPYPGAQTGDRMVGGVRCDEATQQWVTTTSSTDAANYPSGQPINNIVC